MGLVTRKPASCICKNKDADQLRSVTAQLISALVFAIQIVQSLYFLNTQFLVSSQLLWLCSPVLCRTWSETPKTGFLTTRLKWYFAKLRDDQSLEIIVSHVFHNQYVIHYFNKFIIPVIPSIVHFNQFI